MGKHLDLDDVAAQSELAALELRQLRAYADALNLRCIADAPDAERYRWLRENFASVGLGGVELMWDQPDPCDALDSFLDAAIVRAKAVGAA